MIDAVAIKEILETYKKYGWTLRRVLLSDELTLTVGDTRNFFGGVPVITSDLNAAWFSRPPKDGPNAWEIRHLSTDPYSLVEHIDENSADFEARLSSVESRLRSAVRRNS